MEPKEKEARRLITIFHNVIHDNDPKIHWENAKRCALIAVEEILNLEIQQKVGYIVFTSSALKYWQQVKNEIKQL